MPEPPQPIVQRPAVERPIAPAPVSAPHPAFINAARPLAGPSPRAQLDANSPLDIGRLAPEIPPEIVSGSTLATCSSCGLSLSASARFCRRCGTRQHD
jgi:hypothetical protein